MSKKKIFDFVIGNPPYQGENQTNGRQPPVYNIFMDGAFSVANIVELITPARFLFNAGQTPEDWNKKMLEDGHFKILDYQPDSSKVFSNTDIKGGVAISYRCDNKEFGAIGVFTTFPELNTILKKTKNVDINNSSLSTLIQAQGLYRFSDKFMAQHPELSEKTGKGTGAKITSKVVERMPSVFLVNDPLSTTFVKILSRSSNGNRIYRYIKKEYLQENEFLMSYNVLVPESNGSGAIGEVLSTPLIGTPLIGHSDTFLTIGSFKNENEALACLKYVKTKYARVMLGVLKATQHNPASTWKYVPLQDFTSSSDIDWSKSIHEIDEQLYKKYGLDQHEIDFIETNVKEMN